MPAAATPDQADGQVCQPLHVLGLSIQGTLQPAKLSVWKLFMEQVLPLSQRELSLYCRFFSRLRPLLNP